MLMHHHMPATTHQDPSIDIAVHTLSHVPFRCTFGNTDEFYDIPHTASYRLVTVSHCRIAYIYKRNVFVDFLVQFYNIRWIDANLIVYDTGTLYSVVKAF